MTRRPRAAPARARTPRASPTLTATQIRWLGALLLCAQLPRRRTCRSGSPRSASRSSACASCCLRRDRARPRGAAGAHSVVGARALRARRGAVAMRASYGYLLGRDPWVAFLFVLVGIKFLETRTVARRHAARLPRLLPARHAVLLQPVAVRRAGRAARAARARRARSTRSRAHAAIAGARTPRARAAAHRAHDRAGHSARRDAVRAVPARRRAAVGHARRPGAQTGPVRHDGAGDDQRAVAVRRGRVPRRFDGASRRPRAALLARPGAVALRRPRMDARRRSAAPARFAADAERASSLHGHARAALQALAVRARPAREPAAPVGGDDAATRRRLRGPHARPAADRRARRSRRCCATRSVSVLRDELSRRDADEVADNLRLPRARAIRGRSRSRASCARRTPTTARYIDARARLSSARAVRLHAGAAAARRDPVDGFLFDTRRGFCEHYASAFVVLLRAAGIPARVVTGYQGGEINPRGDYMIVRQSDAHAWAEALVDGQWQRFDPTAAVAPSRIEMGSARALPDRRAGAAVRAARRRLAQGRAARVRRDQPRVAAQRGRLRPRAPARVVARADDSTPAPAGRSRRSPARWALRVGRRRCSRWLGIARATTRARARRCGSRRARGSRARACRGCRTKGRSRTPRARAALAAVRDRVRTRSPSRTRSCATARRRRGPASARRWSRRSRARWTCCRRRRSSAPPRPEAFARAALP